MKPLFTDNQFVNAALLNGAADNTYAEFQRFPRLTWNPGLVQPEAITFGATGLSVGVTIPSGAGVLFNSGIFAEMHGTVTGADTQSATVSFSGLVPGSGSITAYLVASYAEIQQGPYTIVGPPIGHPDYNPNFSPTTAYSGKVASLAVAVQSGAPDNLTVFELARCTLATGATGVTLSTANQLRSGPAAVRPEVLVTGSAAVTVSQLANTLYVTGGLPLTTTLPTAASSRGVEAQLINNSQANFWTIAVAGSDLIYGQSYSASGVSGMSTALIGPGQALTLASNGVAWNITGASRTQRAYTYAGNPNGNVAGYAASGVFAPDTCWDSTNEQLYVCTTTGNASGAAWKQVNPRIALTGPLTIYVATTGNDVTGNGTVGSPFATLQRAWDYCQQKLDLQGYQLTIQLANGTYAAAATNCVGLMLGQSPTQQVNITGNLSTPSNVILTATSNAATISVRGAARVNIRGMRLGSTGGTLAHCLLATEAGFIYTDTMEFTTTSGGCLVATIGGSIYVNGAISVIANANYMFFADSGGFIGCIGRTITFPFIITFSAATAYTYPFGRIDCDSCTFVNAFNVNGARYVSLGWINTNGSGPNYFPGTVAGSLFGYGLYG